VTYNVFIVLRIIIASLLYLFHGSDSSNVFISKVNNIKIDIMGRHHIKSYNY